MGRPQVGQAGAEGRTQDVGRALLGGRQGHRERAGRTAFLGWAEGTAEAEDPRWGPASGETSRLPFILEQSSMGSSDLYRSPLNLYCLDPNPGLVKQHTCQPSQTL